MRLSIAIPEAQAVDAPALLRLVRMAPGHDIAADEQGPVYVALFENFPDSTETVAMLIEEAWDLHDVRIMLEDRPVDSRAKFYLALRCYQESLNSPDAETHCRQQVEKVGRDGRCPDHSCVSYCRFICSPSVGLGREWGGPARLAHLWDIARQAEVDWCPNLRIVKVEGEL